MILASCATKATSRLDGIGEGASLYGMLYDGNNKAVAGCAIGLEDSPSTTTDVNGRFLFDFVKYGDHLLSFRKDGYEDCQLQVSFIIKSQVVYARIISQEDLLSATRKSISARNWEEAKAFLGRSQGIGPKEPQTSFLWATIAYRQKDYSKASSILEALVSADYREPYIYAFLADIYQYHSEEPKKAITPLEAFLSLREDAELRARLQKLRE